MTVPSGDICGYTYPQDHTIGDHPKHQSCCWRECVDNGDRCIWHADPELVSKSVQELREGVPSEDLRERTEPFDDLLDGAKLSGVDIKDEINLKNIGLRKADLSEADLSAANLSGTDLWDADLSDADLPVADLSEAVMADADISDANLGKADLTGADLPAADLSHAFLRNTKFSEANLREVTLSEANPKAADFSNADLKATNLTHADLWEADLTDANLWEADLTDANLVNADLTNANLERATLIGVNLFDADLTNIMPYGARIEALQINRGTQFHTNKDCYRRWWQRGPLNPPPRCGYDPAVEQPEQALGTDREELLTKAADTYRQFEKIARQNSQPSLQSSMFVLRQDMQRKGYAERGQYGQAISNRIFRILFKHGESFSRILLSAAAIVLFFAGVYWHADLILTNPDAIPSEQVYLDSFLNALYFSTLTFTTLGLGDFQPAAAAQLGRALVLLEAILGAVLIATFVFVLGRRAAR